MSPWISQCQVSARSEVEKKMARLNEAHVYYGIPGWEFLQYTSPKGCSWVFESPKFKMWQYGPYNRNAKMHMLYIDHSLWPQKVRGSLTSKLSPRLFQGLFEGIQFPGRPCLAPLMCKSGWEIIWQIAVVELVKSSCSVADCVQSLAENSMCDKRCICI